MQAQLAASRKRGTAIRPTTRLPFRLLRTVKEARRDFMDPPKNRYVRCESRRHVDVEMLEAQRRGPPSLLIIVLVLVKYRPDAPLDLRHKRGLRDAPPRPAHPRRRVAGLRRGGRRIDVDHPLDHHRHARPARRALLPARVYHLRARLELPAQPEVDRRALLVDRDRVSRLRVRAHACGGGHGGARASCARARAGHPTPFLSPSTSAALGWRACSGVRPVKGSCWCVISHRSTPYEYTSHFSSYGWCVITSGAIIRYEPVSAVCSRPLRACVAMPKSATFACCCSSSSTFGALMSRCITLCWCRYASPVATCA